MWIAALVVYMDPDSSGHSEYVPKQRPNLGSQADVVSIQVVSG